MFNKLANASTSGSLSVSITKGRPYLSSDEPLAPVNKDKILRDFKIVEEAKRAAEKELPPPEAKDLSPTEQKIQDIYQEVVTWYATYTASVLSNKDKQLQQDQYDVRNSETAARLVPTEFKNSLEQTINGYKVQLQHEKEQIFLARKEYKDFQKDNKLSRPCKEISTFRFWSQILLIPIFISLESVLNAKLFSTNMEGGLLDGLYYAALFSGINTLICFLVGRSGWALNFFHVNPFKKFIGLLVFLAVFGFVIFFGLFVGHYRDALQISLENASAIGWQTFKDNPFGLKDMMSWILCLLTFGIGTLSFFDGLFLQDPYPGYASKTKKFEQARENWENFYSYIVNSMNALQEEYKDKFEVNVKRSQNALASVKAAFLEKENILNKYDNAHKNAQKSIRSIIGQYRYENQLVRNTPAPKYFNEYEIFDYGYIPPVIAGKDWSMDVTDEIKVGQNEIAELNRLVDALIRDKLSIEEEIINTYKDQRGALKASLDEAITADFEPLISQNSVQINSQPVLATERQ